MIAVVGGYAQSIGIDARSDSTAEPELGVAGDKSIETWIDDRKKGDYQSAGD